MVPCGLSYRSDVPPERSSAWRASGLLVLAYFGCLLSLLPFYGLSVRTFVGSFCKSFACFSVCLPVVLCVRDLGSAVRLQQYPLQQLGICNCELLLHMLPILGVHVVSSVPGEAAIGRI